MLIGAKFHQRNTGCGVKFCIVFLVFVVGLFSQQAAALTPQQKQLFEEGVNYFNFADCSNSTSTTTTTTVTPGSGSPTGLTFPNLSPAAMANAINQFIKKAQPNSPLNGLGQTIVDSAKHSNVSPFLIVSIADQETALGTVNTPQVTEGHAVFDRRATPSQPHISIATGLWYKWSSFKASVDYTAPENKNANGGGDVASYIRYQYGKELDSNDLNAFTRAYDSTGYATDFKNYTIWMKEMANSAGSSGSSGSSSGSNIPQSQSNNTSSTSASNAVSFDDSQSSDTGGVTTIDDDGIDPSPTGSSDHQSQTSYANGRLGALHTNYFALNPGWAKAKGLTLGDVGALTYKGKTVYAVYGDNHVGNTPHAEISVAAAMALTGITNPAKAENSLSGVHFTIYPGTYKQLNGSVDQNKINQVGEQVSGGTAPSQPGQPNSDQCCPSSGSGGTADVTITGNNVKDAFVFFTQNGFTDQQAAAIVGSMMGESGTSLNPQSEGSGGYGIAGFTPPGPVEAWITAHGEDPMSLTGQLDYLIYTITKSSPSVAAAVKNTDTIHDASYAWLDNYEKCAGYNTDPNGNCHEDTRIQYANAVLGQYGSGGGGGSTPTCQGSGAPVGVNGLANPFPDGWTPGRLDMGYDGHFTNKIVSPCDGKMIYVYPDTDHDANGGWEGAYYVVQCSQTLPGIPSSAFYFAEGTSPTVKQGDSVSAGQQIGEPGWTGYSEGPAGIEWGLAVASNPRETVAASLGNSCAVGSASQKMVMSWSQWLQQNLKVSAPAETDHAGCA